LPADYTSSFRDDAPSTFVSTAASSAGVASAGGHVHVAMPAFPNDLYMGTRFIATCFSSYSFLFVVLPVAYFADVRFLFHRVAQLLLLLLFLCTVPLLTVKCVDAFGNIVLTSLLVIGCVVVCLCRLISSMF
jgi:hypothetical protein